MDLARVQFAQYTWMSSLITSSTHVCIDQNDDNSKHLVECLEKLIFQIIKIIVSTSLTSTSNKLYGTVLRLVNMFNALPLSNEQQRP